MARMPSLFPDLMPKVNQGLLSPFGPPEKENPEPPGLLGRDAIRRARRSALLHGGLQLLSQSGWQTGAAPTMGEALAPAGAVGMQAYQGSMAHEQARMQQQALQDTLQDPELTAGLTEQQRMILSAMPPEQQLQVLQERIFSDTEEEPITLDAGDTLVGRGADGNYEALYQAPSPEDDSVGTELGGFLRLSGLTPEALDHLPDEQRQSVLDAYQNYRSSGRTQVQVNTGEQSQSRLVDIEAQGYEEAVTRGRAARQTMNQVVTLESLLERAPTGGIEDMTMGLRNIAASLGIGNADQLGAQQVLNAISNDMTIDLTQKLAGQISNHELNFIRDAVPSMGLTPEGNKLLLEVFRRKAQFDLEYSNEAQRYVRRTRDLMGLDAHMAEWARRRGFSIEDLIPEAPF